MSEVYENKVRREGLRGNKLAVASSVSVAALFIAARFWRLAASCLWFDEIFSVHAARHAWADLIHFVAADIIHPPLFYALLKVWIGIGGESLMWLRLFPALTSIATIVPLFLLFREFRLRPGEINFSLLLLAVNGYLIKYAQEVRMYSLLLFFSLFSLWLFIRFFRSQTTSRAQLLALFAINLLLVYTHYSGWLLVGLQISALLLWKRGKCGTFLITIAALLLAYIPWIYAIATGNESGKGLTQNIGWVTKPHITDLAQYFTLLNKPFLSIQSSAEAIYDPISFSLALLLFGIPLLICFWRLVKSRLNQDDDQSIRMLLLFSLAPVLLIFAASWLLPYSIWGTRHLIFAAGPYSILAAFAIRELRPYWTRVTFSIVLGAWFLLAGLILLIRRPPDFIWCKWEELSPQMMSIEAGSDKVELYVFEDLVAYQLWFALNAPQNPQINLRVIKNLPGVAEDPAYFLPRRFTDIPLQYQIPPNQDHLWVAFRAPRWDESSPPLSMAKGMGYRVGQVLSKKAQGQEVFFVQLLRE